MQKCPAPRPAKPDLILAGLLQDNIAEITGHVGQQVVAGITNFIQNLLTNTTNGGKPATALGNADDKTAVGADLGNGVADVRVIRNRMPIGIVAAGTLGATFNDVPT